MKKKLFTLLFFIFAVAALYCFAGAITDSFSFLDAVPDYGDHAWRNLGWIVLGLLSSVLALVSFGFKLKTAETKV